MNGTEELLLSGDGKTFLLGVEREHYEVRVCAANVLLDCLAESFGRNLRQDLLHDIVLVLDAGDRIVVEE